MSDKTTQSIEAGAEDAVLTRRRMLRAAVATAPVIATLPTGAALARSSNLIGQTSGSGTDAAGRTLCLNLNSGTYSNGLLDLGVPPDGNLTAIKPRDYRKDDSFWAGEISEKAMCNQGGRFYYWSSGWRTANVPRGIVVSATALSSFAGSIYTREV